MCNGEWQLIYIQHTESKATNMPLSSWWNPLQPIVLVICFTRPSVSEMQEAPSEPFYKYLLPCSTSDLGIWDRCNNSVWTIEWREKKNTLKWESDRDQSLGVNVIYLAAVNKYPWGPMPLLAALWYDFSLTGNYYSTLPRCLCCAKFSCCPTAATNFNVFHWNLVQNLQ